MKKRAEKQRESQSYWGYNTHTLANGLRIIHRPSDSPVVYCGYEINAGTRNETSAEVGMAHFCEHTSFKGTQRRTAWNILNGLESVGGDLNAFTNKEDTVYYAAILKEHAPKAVDLLSDIVFHSIYPQNELEKEVEVICDEIESYNDSPAERIYDDFENAVFSGHPLGHNILGSAEQLRTYTSADALSFTRRFYRPDNMIFFAHGDIDFRLLVRLLRKATSSFPAAQPCVDTHEKKPLPTYVPQTLVRDMDTHQAHVMLGNRAFSTYDRRRMPLYLVNNLLGGPGMNARLNIALRERHALVYTVESNMVSYADTGVWCVYFGCDPHDVQKCLRLVRRELDRLIERPLSHRALLAAKKQIKGQICVACDNRESFALDFGKSFLHFNREKSIPALLQQIDAITAEEIQQAAQQVFATSTITTLVYGPQGVLDSRTGKTTNR